MNRKEVQVMLGKHIAQIRESRGLTQEQLGHLCGKDAQSINRLEKGNRNVGIFYLYQVAEGLGIPTKELINF